MRYHCDDSACSDVDFFHAYFKRARDFSLFPHARTHRDIHIMVCVNPGERPEHELFAHTCPANVDPEDDKLVEYALSLVFNTLGNCEINIQLIPAPPDSG
eukprot:955868_1